MRASGFAEVLVGTIAAFSIVGCTAGQPPGTIPPDVDQLELAEQGMAPLPEDRVRLEVQQRVDDLRQSGPAARELQRYGASLTEEWQTIAKRLGQDVEFGDWECFAAGCSVVSRHAAEGALTPTLAEFAHSEAFLRWRAGKFQGAPLRSEDDRIEVAWIFFAPSGDASPADSDDRFDSFGPAPPAPPYAPEELR